MGSDLYDDDDDDDGRFLTLMIGWYYDFDTKHGVNG